MRVEQETPEPRRRKRRRRRVDHYDEYEEDDGYDDGYDRQEYHPRRRRARTSPPRKRARYSDNPEVQNLTERNLALQQWSLKQRVKRMHAEQALKQSQTDFTTLQQGHNEYKKLINIRNSRQGIRLRGRT